jgi:hypothetical protein
MSAPIRIDMTVSSAVTTAPFARAGSDCKNSDSSKSMSEIAGF